MNIDRGWIQVLFDMRLEVLWVRVFGYGFRLGSKRLHTPLFSERAGYRKVFYRGPFIFELLKPREVK